MRITKLVVISIWLVIALITPCFAEVTGCGIAAADNKGKCYYCGNIDKDTGEILLCGECQKLKAEESAKE